MARYRVTISSPDREAMLDLVRKHRIAVFEHGVRVGGDAGHSVDALADETEIAALKRNGYSVERHEDVDQAAEERRREIGAGNRYLDRKRGSDKEE